MYLREIVTLAPGRSRKGKGPKLEREGRQGGMTMTVIL